MFFVFCFWFCGRNALRPYMGGWPGPPRVSGDVVRRNGFRVKSCYFWFLLILGFKWLILIWFCFFRFTRTRHAVSLLHPLWFCGRNCVPTYHHPQSGFTSSMFHPGRTISTPNWENWISSGMVASCLVTSISLAKRCR